MGPIRLNGPGDFYTVIDQVADRGTYIEAGIENPSEKIATIQVLKDVISIEKRYDSLATINAKFGSEVAVEATETALAISIPVFEVAIGEGVKTRMTDTTIESHIYVDDENRTVDLHMDKANVHIEVTQGSSFSVIDVQPTEILIKNEAGATLRISGDGVSAVNSAGFGISTGSGTVEITSPLIIPQVDKATLLSGDYPGNIAIYYYNENDNDGVRLAFKDHVNAVWKNASDNSVVA